MAKKYYWLRLKDDWFNSKVIKKLRKIAGGDTYTVIYLKMQLLSLKNEGRIYYEGVEENFEEELALDLDEDVDNVTVTISYLQKCGLLEIINADEYLLTEVPVSIGSETDSAERKRRSRANINKKLSGEELGQCHSAVTMRHTEIEIDIEKEIHKEIDIDSCPEQKASGPQEPPFITLPLNTGEHEIYQRDIDVFQQLYPAVDVPQAMRSMKGWLMTNPTKRKTKRGIGRFVNSWLAREQDKGARSVGYNARTPDTVGVDPLRAMIEGGEFDD